MNIVEASSQRIHGGPDALGVPRFDFSSNSNACGPCPIVLAAVQQADATYYPDASYATLRARLAAFHGVEAQRVLLAGSASEFIFRITACMAQQGERDGQGKVCLPPYSYGDYAQAAQAWGLGLTAQPMEAQLVWACEPSSPLGGAHAFWPGVLPAPVVLDRAYEPLRLSSAPSLTEAQLAQVWQLWTPNKALGLTGVRAAYVIAPLGAQATVAALERLCASWPLGAHGVALLQAWVQPRVQAWLAGSLPVLRDWKARQVAMLQALGWTCLPSDANFFCARPGQALDLNRSRAAGIKLRDAASFGLSGHVRISVQPPAAQDALKMAWQSMATPAPNSTNREMT
ncbi:aminotransferase class I/II-fold pyridoxal phosphate-dependent enzyme [Rhodoferax sp. UBA5149]|uniref:aminotransferase class I/II-fold pyridoxal phosphate-dependent enzyme n=1 Tax=Rhodoferax sp. UBA5149 TaxID=1947379 RepID=UPI0025E2CB4E|nr:aminotransferase class I/II-fold pyridoxal phosphate-dependent enzyme [Rhodoferax sp. UBA5149]